MSVWDWLLVADAAAFAAYVAGMVWVGSLAWGELAKRQRPAVRRHPGHYGTREE